MKSNLLKSLRLTVVLCVFFGVFYVSVLWLFARVAGPNGGNAGVSVSGGKVVGGANVGQRFTSPVYFWGRPSRAGEGYDAANSGGSNKATTDPGYLAGVEARVDAFLARHPYLKRADVPAEMVTASGSGLDPDISPASAYAQVKRVAVARDMPEERVRAIVDEIVEGPLLGVFGPSKVNVLRLNIALDERAHRLP